MVKDRDNQEFKGALGTSAPPADRYGLRPSSLAPEDDPALREERAMRSLFNNASRIPHGHAQLIAALASGRPEARTPGLTEKERQRENTERYYTQQMQRLAEWNAQVVTIGGVQMTNEDAQRARRRFIENEDEHAERAVQKGYIRADQKERFKHEMRRECELEDREGRGVITGEERAEKERLKRSTLAPSRGRMIADMHREMHPSAEQRQSAKTSRNDPDIEKNNLFQSAPDLQGQFTASHTGQAIKQSPESEIVPVPQQRPEVKTTIATGLNI